MNELKQRLVVLEKIVTGLIEIEEVSLKNLTKEEKKQLEKTLKYMSKGESEKFMSLEDLGKKLGLG